MKPQFTLLALLGAALVNAPAAIVTYDWNNGFADSGLVPGDGSGWWDIRTPSGLTGTIVGLQIRLNLTENPIEENNGDLYAYLSHGSTLVVLLNRVGRTALNEDGYLDGGFNVTLTDTAATDVHSYGGNGGNPVTGSYQPDGRNLDPTSSAAVFDAAIRQNGGHPLALFTGLDPNGNWTLFLSDYGAIGQSTLASWGMTLDLDEPPSTAAPEPNQLAMAAMVTLAGAGFALRQRPRRPRRFPSFLSSHRSVEDRSRHG